MKTIKNSNISQKFVLVAKLFVDLVKERYGNVLASAVLYGSVAKGNPNADSDIDILLIFHNIEDKNIFDEVDMVYPFTKEIQEPEPFKDLSAEGYDPMVSPVVYSAEELKNYTPLFFLDVLEDGIILHDDGTWRNKRDAVLKRMKEFGTKKTIFKNGSYVWVVKPNMQIREEVSL